MDIGNTNITFGLTDTKTIKRIFRIGTRRGITSHELMTHYLCHLGPEERSSIGLALVSSVVPEVETELKVFFEELGIRSWFIDYRAVPMKLNYRRPEELGIDRLIVAYGAKELYGEPLIVVDMGTATTFNCVGKEGSFLGGCILPGLLTSLESLGKRGAKLPLLEDLRPPPRLLSDNTADAMRGGILYGYASLIEGIIDRLQKEMECEADVILTGGLSKLITNLLRPHIRYEPWLLMHGLMTLSRSQSL